MDKSKTVFILGAGASKTINLPMQNELLSCIFQLKSPKFNVESSIMQLQFNQNEQILLKLYEQFNQQRMKLADFIINNFGIHALVAEYLAISPTIDLSNLPTNDIMFRIFNIASRVTVTLEDIYTLFDKIIIGREHFRLYSSENIQEIHKSLCKCIIYTIAYFNVVYVSENNPVKTFAQKLLECRLSSGAAINRISVVTMNWDAYLEKTLFSLCEEHNNANARKKVYPDLCFYDYCYNAHDNRVVSTQVRAKGHRNIKILKLHGSINWLVCPRCGRVYVDYFQDIAVNELLNETFCRLCHEEFHGNSSSPQMHDLIITPTFLKDLNSLNIKNIWHNALIELSEASKVVFIGYSFPDADFEMRCLLKKALKPETKIDVVLHSTDDPQYYRSMLVGYVGIDQIVAKLSLPEGRYRSFFGKTGLDFFYCGMEEYVNNILTEDI